MVTENEISKIVGCTFDYMKVCEDFVQDCDINNMPILYDKIKEHVEVSESVVKDYIYGDWEPVKKCCAICEHLYNDLTCPLYHTYSTANECGDYNFDNNAKYKTSCLNFKINNKLSYEN